MKNREYDQRARGGQELKAHRAGRRLSFLRAIFAKCYECCGGVRAEIENCDIKECPLWPHNPYIRTKGKHFKGNAEALERARQNRTKQKGRTP